MAKGTGHEHFEHGFTPIPNEVMEGLAAACLNGTQFRIILLVLRETYGFQRKECSLSETYIASRLGIRVKSVKRSIKELLNSGVLIVSRKETFTTPRVIAFNKSRLLLQKALQKSNPTTGVKNVPTTGDEIVPPTGVKNVPTTGVNLDPHRKKPSQETIKETSQKTITPPRKEKAVGLREGNEENRVILPFVPQGEDSKEPASGGVFSEGFKEFLKLFPESTPGGSKMIAWDQWQDLNPDKVQEHEISEQAAALLGDRPELLPSYILGQYSAQKEKR